HHGVGSGQAETVLREPEGPPHQFDVRVVLHVSPHRGARTRTEGVKRTGGPAARAVHLVRSSSPIPTLTVGPGISPGPPLSGSEGVADFHRRWGVAPRPEDELLVSYREVYVR